MSGSVKGIVVAQLSAITMMQVGSSIPQNVNRAISDADGQKLPIGKRRLSKLADSGSDGRRDLPASDVADIAKEFTVQVYCQGVSAKVSSETAHTMDFSAWTAH